MKDFESIDIPLEDMAGKEKNKSDFTKFHEQKAEEEREKIKELNEKFKNTVKEFEEVKKKS